MAKPRASGDVARRAHDAGRADDGSDGDQDTLDVVHGDAHVSWRCRR
jgi:hypothetical protein